MVMDVSIINGHWYATNKSDINEDDTMLVANAVGIG
jgi:hypothetical protein